MQNEHKYQAKYRLSLTDSFKRSSGLQSKGFSKMTFIINIFREIFFCISHKVNYLLPNKLNLHDSCILLMLSHSVWIERVLFHQALFTKGKSREKE